MRKTTLLRRMITIFGVFALTFLFLSCDEEQQDKAVVFFSVDSAKDGSARTVFPQVSLTDAASYKLLGGLTGNAETVLVDSFTGSGTSVQLEPGTWNFTLNAYNNSGGHILQGQVSGKQINSSGTNQVSFSLSPLKSGTGSIQITLNFPETAGINSIDVNGDFELQTFTPTTGGSFIFTKNGIACEDYFINFNLYHDEILKAVVSELVLVRNNLTSSKTITLTEANIKPLPVSDDPVLEVTVDPFIIGIEEWTLMTEQTAQASSNTNKIFNVSGTYTAYRWYLDGTPVGTSASSYTFNRPAGVYQLAVVVTDSKGESRSGRCRVTVAASSTTTYTVTFNINSGTGTAPTALTVNSGTGIILPSGSGLTRSGYIFGGWNTSSAGTGTNYNAGASYTPTGTATSITLYAKWTATYTVTFNINSGTGTAPTAQTVISGNSITLPSGSGLTRSGYAFGGWNTATAGTGTNYDASTSYTPTASVTLYAKWNSTTQYTVTFNVNGGTGTAPTSQTVVSGTVITLPSGSGLSRTGYTFGGWNTLANGTGTNYNAGASYTVTATATLYAKWNSTGGGGTGTGTIFSEDFEGTNSFTIVNGSQTNKWYVGTAAKYEGTKSAYISNDSGTSNAYTITATSTVHLYRDVTFPASTSPYTLTFYWRAQGEGASTLYDYLRVFLVETSVTPTAGTLLSGTGLGTYNLGDTTWNQATISIPATNSGTTKRLVFTWVNDNSQGTAPPAAVDNIVLTGIFADTGGGGGGGGTGTGTGTESDPYPLTMNTWRDGNITSAAGTVWYSFPVTSGTTYRVWWNDGYSSGGDGSKTLDVKVSATYSNGTAIFTDIDSAWSTAQSFTANQTGTVKIKVVPYTSGNTGTFAVVYSTSTTRPTVPNGTESAPYPLTMNTWLSGTLTTTTTTVWYSFPVTSGTTYYVWWNDKGDGSGTTGEVVVGGSYDKSIFFFGGNTNTVDSGYTTPQSFTANQTGTAYVRVTVRGGNNANVGTFAVVYSTSSTRP